MDKQLFAPLDYDPYTLEQFDEVAAALGITGPDLKPFLQHGNKVYVLDLGRRRYSLWAYTKEEALSTDGAREFFRQVPRERFNPLKSTGKPKLWKELQIELCKHVHYVVYDSVQSCGLVRGEEGLTLRINAQPKAAVEAIRSELVDVWLRSFFGLEVPDFKDWIKSLDRLQEAAPLLRLEGDQGCGKTLLTRAIARFFPADAIDAGELSGFNSALLGTPIVEVTEATSKWSDVELQAASKRRHHRINQKYMYPVTLVGTCRVVFDGVQTSLDGVRATGTSATVALCNKIQSVEEVTQHLQAIRESS